MNEGRNNIQLLPYVLTTAVVETEVLCPEAVLIRLL